MFQGENIVSSPIESIVLNLRLNWGPQHVTKVFKTVHGIEKTGNHRMRELVLATKGKNKRVLVS